MDNKHEYFIARAGFKHGWHNLESWARRMAEQAVREIDANENEIKQLEVKIEQLRESLKMAGTADEFLICDNGYTLGYVVKAAVAEDK